MPIGMSKGFVDQPRVANLDEFTRFRLRSVGPEQETPVPSLVLWRGTRDSV